MSSNNQISSVLLLILIGLAIFCLLNGNEGFTFNKLTENFSLSGNASSSSSSSSSSSLSSSSAPFSSSSSSAPFSSSSSSAPFSSSSSSAPFSSSSSSTPFSSSSSSTPRSSSSSSSAPQSSSSSSAPRSSSLSSAPFSSSAASSSSAPPLKSTNIFDFEGNDESVFGLEGSLLSDAFNAPVPAGTHTDSVDFNKNNVDNYNAKDFLPHEINDEWFETDFSMAKYNLNDDQLINTDRYMIGINTVGQSLKNASHDIRGTIMNPRTVVSPWNNSSIEPDFNLKSLC
jgi:hypothetical protein